MHCQKLNQYRGIGLYNTASIRNGAYRERAIPGISNYNSRYSLNQPRKGQIKRYNKPELATIAVAPIANTGLPSFRTHPIAPLEEPEIIQLKVSPQAPPPIPLNYVPLEKKKNSETTKTDSSKDQQGAGVAGGSQAVKLSTGIMRLGDLIVGENLGKKEEKRTGIIQEEENPVPKKKRKIYNFTVE